MKKIQALFWDVWKLYEITMFESINKDVLEHSHAHLFIVYSQLQWGVATKIVWS